MKKLQTYIEEVCFSGVCSVDKREFNEKNAQRERERQSFVKSNLIELFANRKTHLS